MFGPEKHLDNLIRHIELVRDATILLGGRLMDRGEIDFGRLLIARGHNHDASKFYGVEWDYLHSGPDTPQDKLNEAIKQHTRTNSHHPEFHGGIENMPRLDVAEMTCDWYARGQEFGTCLRDWIIKEAVPRFKIELKGKQYEWIKDFVDLLLESSFVKD